MQTIYFRFVVMLLHVLGFFFEKYKVKLLGVEPGAVAKKGMPFLTREWAQLPACKDAGGEGTGETIDELGD